MLSRTPSDYYVDNNSEPTVGARVAATYELGDSSSLQLGASGMAGHYDPDGKLLFAIAGAEGVLQLGHAFVRAEYLIRRTRIAHAPSTITTCAHTYSTFSGFRFGRSLEYGVANSEWNGHVNKCPLYAAGSFA